MTEEKLLIEDSRWTPSSVDPLILTFILIIVGISVIIEYITGNMDRKPTRRTVLNISTAITIVLVIGALALFVSYAYNTGEVSRIYSYSTTTIPIASLSDGSEASGSFFLGCGAVNGVSYYYYYTGSGHGPYSLQKIRVDDVDIFTDENTPPAYIHAIPIYQTFHRDGRTEIHSDWSNQTRQEFHVPENTIVKSFVLDGAT